MGRCWAVVFQWSRSTEVLVVVVLLLGSVPAAWAQSGFLNIDCGATSSYDDPNTGLTWVPDAPYISSGKTQALSLPTSLQNFTEMQTLRYFDDTRAKNCYALPVSISGIYLLKLTFYYGNYDNANLPPQFQVAIDATILSNVSLDATGVSHQEYHYMSQGNVTYVCLIRTSPGATPFISGISIKDASGLLSGYDPHFGTFLQGGTIMTTRNRLNFGGTTLIRAPDDYYDRLWLPATSYYFTPNSGNYEFLSTADSISALVHAKFYPPSSVMQTAITTSALQTLVSFLLPENSPSIESFVYISFFFAELNNTASTPLLRNFTIQTPDLSTYSPNIDMSGYNYLYYGYWNFWFNSEVDLGSTTTVVLTPQASARAGPILNCMEIFERSDPRNAKTADQDATAIEGIKMSLNLTEWTGDPCLPFPHSWVTCDTSDPVSRPNPVITAVNLSGYQLVGPLPDSFANLASLTSLDLSNNAFNGSLPDWLTTFPALRILAVQNNNFSGPIPEALLSANSRIVFTYGGNPFLGNHSTPASGGKKSNIAVIAGATVGVVAALALVTVIAILVYCRCKHKRKVPEEMPGARIATPGGAKAYTFAEVTAATAQFNRELGRGGFGPVYYGKLPNGQEVAVKVADGSSKHEERAFFNEVDVLSRVHHRSLVALVGYCQEEKQVLIYEYIHNGSLFDHLHGNSVSCWCSHLEDAPQYCPQCRHKA